MAFKSKAQMEKMKKMVQEGKLSQEKYDAMAKDTPDDLPERIHPAKEKK